MKTLISCAYNMDNCCVELKFSDGSMIAIDTKKTTGGFHWVSKKTICKEGPSLIHYERFR